MNTQASMARGMVQTPLGPVGLTWSDGTLCEVDLEPGSGFVGEVDPPTSLANALAAYFTDPASPCSVPIQLEGTPFQQRVWAALRAITPGQTRTYGDLAAELGTSARAVGGACRANPCPIVVPCHRVVGATGLGGFAGDTSGHRLEVKRWLLRHEGVEIPA